MPTIIIIRVALGRTAELTSDKIIATTLSQSQAHTTPEDLLVAHLEQDNPHPRAQPPQLDHGWAPGHYSKTPIGRTLSTNGNPKITPSNTHRPPSARGPAREGTEKTYTASTPTLPNSETATGIGNWSDAVATARRLNNQDLNSGPRAKSIELLVPSQFSIGASAVRARTPAKPGLTLFADTDRLQPRVTSGNRSHIEVGGCDNADASASNASNEPPILRIVTHPIPSPVALVPPFLAATTFEAYVASLGYGDSDRIMGTSQAPSWRGMRTRPASAQQSPWQERESHVERDTKQTKQTKPC